MGIKRSLAALILVLKMLPALCQGTDTFEVHFPLNISKLDKQSQTYIDQLVTDARFAHSDKLMVIGYTDFVGSNGYNDTLSMARATAVRNYLISSGFDEKYIKLCIGKGKIDRTNITGNEGYAPDRKVQIIIDREAMAVKAPPPGPTLAPGDIDLSKLEVNQTFVLNNIFFKLNSPEILDKSQADLQRLLDFMNHYPTVTIQIEGHVCCMGVTPGTDSKYKGRPLSECRAEAIYNYLVEKGISKDRVKYTGLANLNPIVPNEQSEEDRQKNRRVEVRILSK